MDLHFVSTGPKFPYPYYIGIMTALKTQSERVILWLAEMPKELKFFNLIKDKVYAVRPVGNVPSFPALQGKTRHQKRVAIFDYCIWRIVAHEGGVIMGLDSVTLGDWQCLLEPDKEMLAPVDNDKNGNLSMHGVVVRPNSRLAMAVHRASEAALCGDSRDFEWGSAGVLPYRRIVGKNLSLVTQVGQGLVGGFRNEAGKPFYLYTDGELLNPDTKTIPLYATGDKDFDKVSKELIQRNDTLYAKLVRKSLTEDEWMAKSLPQQFRFHLLGLAHVPTHREVSSCAYTQKVVKLATMLKSLGHKVYFYGGEESEVDCDENVQVVSSQDRIDCYGDYDWRTQFFKHNPKDTAHQTFNVNAITEINARKQKGDFLLCPMGNYDKPISDAVGLVTVESGIGYRGVFCNRRVFESYAWMHYIYGILRQDDGSWYDCVIPNYFDPKDFPFQPDKGDYFLYIGRLIRRKGLDIAVQVTRKLGARLIVAGQGWLVNKNEGLNITDGHVKHVGTVDPEQRKELMGRAKAVFVPTYYIEPFGGVAVEAQMCGTPVITTDWGAMTETVLHGETGFRCRTFDDFVWAARNVGLLSPQDCREWVVSNYSMNRVRWMYQEYFTKLDDMRRQGWYEPRPERQDLNWLRKYYGNRRQATS